MLLKIRQLVIENRGYKRNIVSKNIYINSASIISFSDYSGADNFLLSESSSYSKDNFSLIKVSQGNEIEDIIAFGTADSIYSELNKPVGSKLLND